MLKTVSAIAALLVGPVALLSACSNNSNKESSEDKTSSPPAAPLLIDSLTTQLKGPDGTGVANATIEFMDGYATVTVVTVAAGILNPGFHGLHIHSVGRCEPNSVGPTGGPASDFSSAGEHFQAGGHTGEPASGDLTAFQARSDGSGRMVTTTDAFTEADLKAGEGTALIMHDGSPTLANASAGKRIACGVISPARSTATTTTTTSATTTAPAPAPAPATTAGTTTPSVAPTTAPSPTTTVTDVTTSPAPTITFTSVPVSPSPSGPTTSGPG